MRCKVGDVCQIIGGPVEFLGHIVRITEPSDRFGPRFKGCWETDPPKRAAKDFHPIAYEDYHLLPLGEPPGTDETLTWAGKPQETPTEIIRRETERVS